MVEHFLVRWRHVGRLCEGAAGRSDPVLGPAEFTRRRKSAAHTGHEFFVQVAHEAKRERQRLESRDAVFQGSHVVADFT